MLGLACDARRLLRATTATTIMVTPTRAAMITIINVSDTLLSSLPDDAESGELESSGLDVDVPDTVDPELGGTEANSAMTAP